MCEVNQLEYCCSVLEIGNFGNDFIEEQIKDIRLELVRYLVDNNFDITNKETEYPRVFLATTTTKQVGAEAALRHLGFKATSVLGRHAKNNQDKYLTFWFKRGYRGLLTHAKFNKLAKEVEHRRYCW